jgi:hypothetical protein
MSVVREEKVREENQEAKITITITKSGEQWTSTHELTNIDPLIAAVVMIDVGRDLILGHHFGHEHLDSDLEFAKHGDAAAEN